MKWNSFYPVLMIEELKRSKEFYMNYFGYSVSFEADWYVSLVNKRTNGELALLDLNHETIPEGYGKAAQGLLLNIEVEDVDAIYQKLAIENQLPIVLDIRSEAFGQRHFITRDPNGVLIDVIKVIPANDNYTKQYVDENFGSN